MTPILVANTVRQWRFAISDYVVVHIRENTRTLLYPPFRMGDSSITCRYHIENGLEVSL